MTIRGIIFDKDGTLFDFQATWGAWVEGMLLHLAAGDAALIEVLAHELGYQRAERSFRPGSVVIAETPGVIADVILPHLPHPPLRSDLIAWMNATAAAAPQQSAVPLAPFLSGLIARGLVLGVATNDAEGPAIAHLTSQGVAGHFAFIAGCDSGHGAKPAPGQLLAFTRATGIPQDQTVMVGDSTHDLIAGRAAGMATIGVLTGYASTDDLAPLADAVVPDISHLPDWLDRQA